MSLYLFASPINTTEWTIRDPVHKKISGTSPTSPVSPLMSLDLFENESTYQIVADLPGVAPSDVEVTVEGNSLTLSAERKQGAMSETDKGHRLERSFGSVKRRVVMPKNADMNNANTKFANGVLTVTIPKAPQEQPRKLVINQEQQQ